MTKEFKKHYNDDSPVHSQFLFCGGPDLLHWAAIITRVKLFSSVTHTSDSHRSSFFKSPYNAEKTNITMYIIQIIEVKKTNNNTARTNTAYTNQRRKTGYARVP